MGEKMDKEDRLISQDFEEDLKIVLSSTNLSAVVLAMLCGCNYPRQIAQVTGIIPQNIAVKIRKLEKRHWVTLDESKGRRLYYKLNVKKITDNWKELIRRGWLLYGNPGRPDDPIHEVRRELGIEHPWNVGLDEKKVKEITHDKDFDEFLVNLLIEMYSRIAITNKKLYQVRAPTLYELMISVSIQCTYYHTSSISPKKQKYFDLLKSSAPPPLALVVAQGLEPYFAHDKPVFPSWECFQEKMNKSPSFAKHLNKHR